MKYPQLVSMPSAVSDWLEEQLEARGIDAVVYTRYVLSLLHTHTVDVIYPDEDLQFSRLKKNCEIESLVDELCEKLKEVNSEPNSPSSGADSTSKPSAVKESQKHKITPQELAEKNTEKMDNLNNWELCALENLNNNKRGIQKLKSIINIQDSIDQCVEADVWTNDDDDTKLYENLPVDIHELLESPPPQDDTVEMMNMANMKDNGKRDFIPYGTNITSSIWSNDREINYDNQFNASVEGADSETMLDFKFSSIAIDNNKPDFGWPSTTSVAENVTNTFFENNQEKRREAFLEGFHSLPHSWKSAEEDLFEDEHVLNRLAISLMKLNHNKEKSCFTEVIPRSKPISQTFNPFGRTSSIFSFNTKHAIGFERDKEDLLTSDRSHFRPINEKVENRVQGQYADGATFIISNSLDKVDYKRSESGSMLLETEFGQSKKYWEYRLEDTTPSPELEFVLKFSICQNDKACQTEELSELDLGTTRENCTKTKIEDTGDCIEEYRCTCPTFKMNATSSDSPSGNCLVHPARPESMLGEILWKYDTKICDKCNNTNVTWNTDCLKGDHVDSEWDSQNLRDIWNGGEVCEACLSLNADGRRPPPSLQLREDISQDGEQLLSDLSSLQKCYMEELPLAEISCDINEIVSAASAPKERKRRHSFIAAHIDEAGLDSRGSWSFASRLEEDCLIQMSTLPTLRSVTL
ncbi:hypothetical protein NQ315_005326 [Exocentrus adspersus]|uniref:Uncharacterized protein n=1 Tax=Exocentrus adspersus TaxID=1586481 RepID=A0AAV8W1T8_9CUCU|nr:hypothetical protein NQ315_005326 [Exocentrus adspersus]